MTRYALYYAPAAQTSFWRLGCSWLGRGPSGGVAPPAPSVRGIPPVMMPALTASARRYGFHATLKAPFRLAPGYTETHLLDMAQAFSQTQQPVELPGLQVRRVDDFLALCPTHAVPRIDALAMRCVVYFDLLRAAPTADELARRRLACLSPRQEALLQRWGYPHVEEEFRFHMTLTDSLTAVGDDIAYAMRQAADRHFESVLGGRAAGDAMSLDGLTIFKEPEPGAALKILARFPFTCGEQGEGLPVPGRLFYVVGPSGVGKDSLLQWVRQNLEDRGRVRFATRAITRDAHPSEDHEPLQVDDFWQEAGDGGFSMIWQANGACYAVRRGIEADLRTGRDVVVNGSREYAPRVVEAFPDARIVWITAAADIISHRLAARQREGGAALLQRVRRGSAFTAPEDRHTIHLDNSGPVEVAGARLLALLQN
jgi:phosphonate metabolism protein PhnN/1,5-bisphosphokinase (PRPP-forming)